MRPLSVALLHHPVLDAKGAPGTSTLTSIDLHDLARSARTYGCVHLYVAHPIEAQRTLAHRIIDHWTHGSSAKRIPDRKDALAVVEIVSTLEEAKRASGEGTEVWVTAARAPGATKAWAAAREELGADGPPVLLVFGTSWGLAPEVLAQADAVLEPIRGLGAWNHLSVRSACAIALDRLRG